MSELGPVLFVTRSDRHLARHQREERQYRHPYHILAIHRAEGGVAGLGDETYPVVSGPFICLLPAGDLDDNGMFGRDQAWWSGFSGDSVTSVVGGAQVACSGSHMILPRAHALTEPDARRAETLFRELQDATAADGVGGRLAALARLGDLLALWVATGRGEGHDPLAHFHDLVKERALDPRCALEDLARQVGRHPDTLAASFRRRYGCTPVAFRTSIRLQRARDLLAEDQAMADIAEACGFPDPGYFSRVFRRHVGQTPGEWRRRFTGSG